MFNVQIISRNVKHFGSFMRLLFCESCVEGGECCVHLCVFMNVFLHIYPHCFDLCCMCCDQDLPKHICNVFIVKLQNEIILNS